MADSFEDSIMDGSKEKNNRFANHIFPYVVIILSALITFWQLSFFRNSLKWDMLDISFPWRFFTSEAIRNGYLPLWNPFQYLGFSQHFDPQTWYPISWILGYVSNYSIYTIQGEFLLHIILAGIGMYGLGKTLHFDNKISLFLALSYMLSGFFISNSQHLGWIISGTWIPFILSNYIRTCRTGNLIYPLFTAFFLFMLLTGGYFAFLIILFYILIALFLYFLIKFLLEKNKICFLKLIGNNLLILSSFLLISAVVIFSVTGSIGSFLTRQGGLSLSSVLSGSLQPEDLIGFIFPLATLANWNQGGTDQSLTNSYSGILTLIFILLWLFQNKKKTEYIIIGVGLIFLVAALGTTLPFRSLLYKTVPFFDYFRFPALFRYFTIVSFLILVGFSLQKIINNNKNQSLFKRFSLLFFTLILFGFLLSVVNLIFRSEFKSLFLFANFYETLNSAKAVTIQTAVWCFLLLFTFSFFRSQHKKIIEPILIFCFLDLFLAAQLNIPVSVTYTHSPSTIHKKLSVLPEGFPVPDLKPIAEITDKGHDIHPLWRNMNIFYKNTAHDGYSPYQYQNWKKLEESAIFPFVINSPLVYLSDNYIPININFGDIAREKLRNLPVFLDFYDIPEKAVEISPIQDSLSIVDFWPNGIEVKVQNSKKQLLNFSQNYMPGWKGLINGKETTIIPSNIALMSVLIPPGVNYIRLEYHPQKIYVGFYITAFSFILLCVLLIILSFIKARSEFGLAR